MAIVFSTKICTVGGVRYMGGYQRCPGGQRFVLQLRVHRSRGTARRYARRWLAEHDKRPDH